MYYQKEIKKQLDRTGENCDPRHIEAWMRSESGTLDSLSPWKFKSEIRECVKVAKHADVDTSEALAKSYGL